MVAVANQHPHEMYLPIITTVPTATQCTSTWQAHDKTLEFTLSPGAMRGGTPQSTKHARTHATDHQTTCLHYQQQHACTAQAVSLHVNCATISGVVAPSDYGTKVLAMCCLARLVQNSSDTL